MASKKTTDKQSRKWQITINNPEFSHKEILDKLSQLSSVEYAALVDEKGKTFHTHIFLVTRSPSRFSQWQRLFDKKAHIEAAKGSIKENIDYLRKTGKWQNTEKSETNISDSFEEYGERPEEKGQGFRSDLANLYHMIEEGYSNATIISMMPETAIRYLSNIDKVRTTLLEERYKNTFRNLEVTYIYGKTGSGKTKYVMEYSGNYESIFRVTDFTHPFDGYISQDIIAFEEFASSLKIQDMLVYLDGYPCVLPARYAQRIACFTKVFILSNIPLEKQYPNVQQEAPETYAAFLRRIHKVIHFESSEDIHYYNSVDAYLKREEDFHTIDEKDTPFNDST